MLVMGTKKTLRRVTAVDLQLAYLAIIRRVNQRKQIALKDTEFVDVDSDLVPFKNRRSVA